MICAIDEQPTMPMQALCHESDVPLAVGIGVLSVMQAIVMAPFILAVLGSIALVLAMLVSVILAQFGIVIAPCQDVGPIVHNCQ